MSKLVWLIVIGALVAYMTYCPLPDGIAQPMRVRVLYVNGQILNYYTLCRIHLGLDDEITAIDTFWAIQQWEVSLGLKDEPTIKHADTTFDGVSVRIYEPVEKSTQPLAGIVFLHGGGWVVGSKESYHFTTKYMAARLGVVLVSVDYRMAPKYPFPIPLEDSVKATVWFLQHAREYGVDPTRIAVIGDSAGGNLAAAVSAKLTFEEEYQTINLPKIKFQGLIYPALQAVDFLTPSYQERDIFILTKELMVFVWSWYLSGDLQYAEAMKINNHTTSQFKNTVQKSLLDHALIPSKFKGDNYQPPSDENFGNDEIFSKIQDTLLDPYFAPLMRSDLRGLPPAYILTGGFDVLRDDGILYAKRLEKANVKVTWNNYDSGFHDLINFIGWLGFDVGQQCMDDFIQYARDEL
ncbi:arylacetamide deacetylase-like [Glandiceps talaboti]